MKNSKHIRNTLLCLLALPLLALTLVSCAKDSEKPKPPTGEHPTQNEHPKDAEHPATEHPADAEHPKGAEHPG